MACMQASRVQLRVNGDPSDACANATSAIRAPGGSSNIADGSGPDFRGGAAFCTLGPSWQENDLGGCGVCVGAWRVLRCLG